jgi:uncharacterized RDD family membrane protein YckC
MEAVMPAKVNPGKAPHAPVRRSESYTRVRYRAPFALRCGAILIDYILLMLIMTFSTIIARTMGGGARLAGGTAETVGIVFTLIAAVLDLGVLAGLTGKTLGKWTTGLRIERTDGSVPGIGWALLRHFVGYPVSLFFMGVGFLMAIFVPNGRALHDFMAGTVVIREYGSAGPATRRPRASN